jgi:cell division protein FtsL
MKWKTHKLLFYEERLCIVLLCLVLYFALFVCYLSVVLLYYCHRAEAQLQFNKYI